MQIHAEPTFGIPRPTPVTSLDQRNTTVENPARDRTERLYRFRRFPEELKYLEKALPDLELSVKQRERFESCGHSAWICWSPKLRTYRIHTKTCKLRWCPRCRNRTALRTHIRLSSALKAKPRDRWKLITLTLRSSAFNLSKQIANLKSSFRRLRQRRFWREAVHGGYAVLEITFNEARQQWHPHLHIVADSKFVDQQKLSKEWLVASRGSFIVDVRKVASQAGAIQYLTSYLGKPPALCILRDVKRCNEWIEALAHTRMLQAFGDVPKPSDAEEPENDPKDWTPIMRLATLIQQANAGDANARRILSIVAGSETDPDEPDPYDSP